MAEIYYRINLGGNTVYLSNTKVSDYYSLWSPGDRVCNGRIAIVELDSSNKFYLPSNPSYLFWGCTNGGIDTSKFVTSDCTTLEGLFYNCENLKSADMFRWDTSSVTNMSSLFSGCHSLTSVTFPSLLDVSRVTSFGAMFYECYELTKLDLTKFKIKLSSSLGNTTEMFCKCFKLERIYVPPNSDWKYNVAVAASYRMFFNCTKLPNWDGTDDISRANNTEGGYFTPTPSTVTFKNWDGTVLQGPEWVEIGDTPVYRGSTPTRAETETTRYTFSDWSPTIAEFDDTDTDFIAQYSEETIYYTIRFINGGYGSRYNLVLQTDQLEYGDTPVYRGETPYVENTRYGEIWTFHDWSSIIKPVTASKDYRGSYWVTPDPRIPVIYTKNDLGFFKIGNIYQKNNGYWIRVFPLIKDNGQWWQTELSSEG